MSETLTADAVPVVKDPLRLTAGPDTPGWAAEEETMKTDVNGMVGTEGVVSSAHLEPSTLQWPEDEANQPGGMGDKARSDVKLDRSETDAAVEEVSMQSDFPMGHGGVSRTESEREFGEKDQFELKEKGGHLEIEVEDLNLMPEKAAGVFSPSVTILHSTIMPSISMPEPPKQSMSWEASTEKSPFLGHQVTLPDEYYHEYTKNDGDCCGCAGTNRDVLKMGVSIFMSALIFPVLVWGGHVFLPFDAPIMEGAPLRLVYTLRCSVFAVVPIVLGVLVLGVSRLRYCSLKPQCEGEPDAEKVNVHRRYVDDSISLFLLYFLQLSIMAAYLSQNLLKLVPLLTIIFAFGRLVYWIAAAWGSSVRAFGFGFSFWPMLTMLVANLYFIFMADSAGSIFAPDEPVVPETPPDQRQRFWG